MRTIGIVAVSLLLALSMPPQVMAQIWTSVDDSDMHVGNLSVTVDVPAPRSVYRSQKREAQRHHNLAVCFAEEGKKKEAIEEDKQAIACDPNHPGYQILMGRLLVENGELKEALDCYHHVCKRFPAQATAIAELVTGLEQTLAILNLDCVRNAPSKEICEQLPTLKTAVSVSADADCAAPSKRSSRTKGVLRLFMAEESSADDSTY
jgi:tetratricopeptide (TPR) repeat protein